MKLPTSGIHVHALTSAMILTFRNVIKSKLSSRTSFLLLSVTRISASMEQLIFTKMILGGSGSSVTPAVPPSLGSTFSQSDSGVLSDALMAAELSSYFCLLVVRFSSWFSASQQINSCVVAVEYRGLYFRVSLVYRAVAWWLFISWGSLAYLATPPPPPPPPRRNRAAQATRVRSMNK